ncbi:phenylacetate-CoA oxygenase subunit PaaJ [Peribacillus cavernae]|uniref:Phenylacetate-CoA oxygenase subunit PaaJ n=1 Tax=Peribacillus cavernae TaxID=1674310 RepID=A0A3S1BCD2_9BACI|nr:1,2-phenylacetyl-CoA epoxidase subunit PaaD [Peribacillus cavernae]MDQ0218097.1 ring-1,2-phenylacetyl-CoA epoxidase subunit PaaD [Peribacillus cavernae]RUQ32746.1 phenylacetate-CoA oxygenase subunit PaaJ [Peribacillus cavernae]
MVNNIDTVNENIIWECLYDVEDPELPISIVDLGIVNQVAIVRDETVNNGSKVFVDITPTFTGCPAWKEIEKRVIENVSLIENVTEVQVRLNYSTEWTLEKISLKGKAKLNEFGVAMSKIWRGKEIVRCPRCKATNVSRENEFGPTLCKMIYYCNDCREPFEALKSLL